MRVLPKLAVYILFLPTPILACEAAGYRALFDFGDIMQTATAIQPDTKETKVFWGEMSPCDHLVQIYQDDEILLDSLEGFVAGDSSG